MSVIWRSVYFWLLLCSKYKAEAQRLAWRWQDTTCARELWYIQVPTNNTTNNNHKQQQQPNNNNIGYFVVGFQIQIQILASCQQFASLFHHNLNWNAKTLAQTDRQTDMQNLKQQILSFKQNTKLNNFFLILSAIWISSFVFPNCEQNLHFECRNCGNKCIFCLKSCTNTSTRNNFLCTCLCCWCVLQLYFQLWVKFESTSLVQTQLNST